LAGKRRVEMIAPAARPNPSGPLVDIVAMGSEPDDELDSG
jgi:hypothetical protein